MNAPQECPLTQQAVGWALHALEPDEEMAVLLHLPQCAACRTAAYDAEQVLTGLGGVVPLVEPPAGLRDRLMAEVADTPQRPPIVRPRPALDDADGTLPTAPVPTERAPEPRRAPVAEDTVAEAPRRGWFARGNRRTQLVAAALVAAAVLSVGALAVRTTQLERERDAGTAQAQTLGRLISELGRPGAQYALLADTDTGATVAAVLVDDGQPQVYSVALPANAPDSVYVAWGLPADGAPVPLGTFDIAAAEQGPLPVGSATEAESFPQYAVSIEPGRVAPASPSTVVASGQVTI